MHSCDVLKDLCHLVKTEYFFVLPKRIKVSLRRDTRLSASAKEIYSEMICSVYAQKVPFVEWTVKQISENLIISESSVKKSLAELSKYGYIRRENRGQDPKNKHRKLPSITYPLITAEMYDVVGDELIRKNHVETDTLGSYRRRIEKSGVYKEGGQGKEIKAKVISGGYIKGKPLVNSKRVLPLGKARRSLGNETMISETYEDDLRSVNEGPIESLNKSISEYMDYCREHAGADDKSSRWVFEVDEGDLLFESLIEEALTKRPVYSDAMLPTDLVNEAMSGCDNEFVRQVKFSIDNGLMSGYGNFAKQINIAKKLNRQKNWNNPNEMIRH